MSRLIGPVCDCKNCYSSRRIHFIRNYIDVHCELAIYMAYIAEQAVRVNVQPVSAEISAVLWGTACLLCVGNALPLHLSFSSLWCCCVRYFADTTLYINFFRVSWRYTSREPHTLHA